MDVNTPDKQDGTGMALGGCGPSTPVRDGRETQARAITPSRESEGTSKITARPNDPQC